MTDQAWVAGHMALLNRPIPAHARAMLGLLQADTLAIASHARLHRVGGTRVDQVLAPGNDQGSAVWGATFRAAPADAAFLNGCAAEALDFQEVLINPRNNGHSAVVIVPALLALAEQRGIAGERLLRALWIAFAANIGLAEALGRGHRSARAGFRTTSVIAPIAASLGAAALVSDDPALALHAVAIAATSLNAGLLASLSPRVGSYSLDKDLAVGLAARHAVNAVQLAEAGATGPSAPLTGEHGWLASYGFDGDDAARLRRAPDDHDLGGYAIKPYPACFGCQSAIRAALDLSGLLPFERIERVVVEVNQASASSLSTRLLPNALAARFSLPYAVASAFVRGASTLSDFDPSALDDAEVGAFMRKVEVQASAALTAEQKATGGFPARLSVHLQDGRHVQLGRAGPLDGLDPAGRRAAFEAKLKSLCTAPVAQRLLRLSEQPEDIRDLVFSAPP